MTKEQKYQRMIAEMRRLQSEIARIALQVRTIQADLAKMDLATDDE